MEIGTNPANGFENTQKKKEFDISEMEKGAVTVDAASPPFLSSIFIRRNRNRSEEGEQLCHFVFCHWNLLNTAPYVLIEP